MVAMWRVIGRVEEATSSRGCDWDGVEVHDRMKMELNGLRKFKNGLREWQGHLVHGLNQ